jgi:hypothetical protein
MIYMGVDIHLQVFITSPLHLGKLPASRFESLIHLLLASIRLEFGCTPDGRGVEINLCSSR